MAELDQSPGTVTNPSALASGSKLGRYSIIAPLGAGGMGVVYRARDEKLERDVAIKLLAPGAFNGDEARRRFHKEALALAKISHTHIAAVYDVGEQDGTDYIVMECVPGHSLAEKLQAGPLTVKDATAILLQIAQALEEAQEQGIVHRDLKPANVMITPKGHAKVLDFGLAKLLSTRSADATISIGDTRGVLGTPLYMSPEQAEGKDLDARTDLWSLGVLYYESLTGTRPFQGDGSLAILRAIVEREPTPINQLRPDLPPLAVQIVARALKKNPAARYQTASEMAHDASELLAQFSAPSIALEKSRKSLSRPVLAAITLSFILLIALGTWFFYRMSQRNWAQVKAPSQIAELIAQRKSLAAFALLQKARKIAPSDPQLQQLATENLSTIGVSSTPSGATVDIQDYNSPDAPWIRLGTTPIKAATIPNGHFRWKVAKPGVGELMSAPSTDDEMRFPLDQAVAAPAGMTFVPASKWADYITFVGWIGPYPLPAFYLDKYEVTNREYQKFVDSGGYSKRELWPATFPLDGHNLSFSEAMDRLRDTTGRPGPSTWAGGHYPEGKADFPVAGVSWFEASAYASWAGKSLATVPQWFEAAPPDLQAYAMQSSNLSGTAPASVGSYNSIGAFGNYDMAGNVREWAANPSNDGTRFILGGSWLSPVYISFEPEAIPPFDRSDTNGFRCVRNLGPLPREALASITHFTRDFSTFKPASDDVFHAYKLLYDYPKTPLNEKTEGIVQETVDWREEKVSFDAGYRGERMSAYLFLPKNVKPPYQTVLFFPSARVEVIRDNDNGRALGDISFFDYVVQSGRAVIYPIYQDTYERRVKGGYPGASQPIERTTDWYKDAARSLDYLATRPDIDSSKLAYLGVSMGSADGVIISSLLQDRLKTVVLLDGGFFLDPPPPGGDQADFAVRMKKPVLMVNGRYDFAFSPELAQNPLFNMLGTPADDKRHVILDTAHDVTGQRPQLTKAVLDWLDKYMGRVDGN